MAEVVWSEPALADLEAIAEYIALENPRAASELIARILDRTDQLSAHPDSGPRPPELGRSRYRQLVEPPCRIFYRHADGIVLIVHVMRTERLLRPAHLSR